VVCEKSHVVFDNLNPLLLEATWSLLNRWHHHHGHSKQPCSTKIEELHAEKGGYEKK
jgi:hypothetical protein